MPSLFKITYEGPQRNQAEAIILGTSHEDAHNMVLENARTPVQIVGTHTLSNRLDGITDKYMQKIKNACGFLSVSDIKAKGYKSKEEFDHQIQNLRLEYESKIEELERKLLAMEKKTERKPRPKKLKKV